MPTVPPLGEGRGALQRAVRIFWEGRGRMHTLGAACSGSPRGLCRIPSVWANCEEMDGLPLRLLIATRASHLIKLEILSLFWIYLESNTKLPQPNPHPSSLLAAVFTAATVQLEYTKETQF